MALSKFLRRYRAWIATGAVAIVALVAFLVWRNATNTETPTTYTTEEATAGSLSVTVSGSGNIEVYDTTEVWPRTSGTVQSVTVRKGQRVESGDILFSLEDDAASAAAAKAWSSYKQAVQSVTNAESGLIKTENALDEFEDRADDPTTTVTSGQLKAARKDVTAAKQGVTVAKLQRDSAAAENQKTQADLDKLVIVAPTDGIVWSLDVEEGDSVSPGGSGASDTSGASSSSQGGSTAPVVLAPDDPLAVSVSVNEVDVPSLKVGQRVDLELEALPDLALTGKVAEIADDGTIDQGVVTYEVWIRPDVSPESLRSGLSVEASILTSMTSNAVLVPNSAVKTDDDGTYVMVLAAGKETPQRADVTVGLEGSAMTQILSGVKAGDKVVTQSTSDSSDSSQQQRGGFMMMGGGPGGR